MTGESPGREQQHGASGEVADRIAEDPRLAVFKSPAETRETPDADRSANTSDVSAEHAGASPDGDSAPRTAAPAADGASPARPQPVREQSSGSAAAAPDDAGTVSGAPTPAGTRASEASRPEGVEPTKTEPNRDPGAGSEAPAEADGTGERGEQAASAAASEPSEEAQDPAGSEDGTPDRRGSAALERTPVAEEDARSGGGRESEVRPARPSASPAAEAVAAGASEGAASSDPDDPDDPDSEDAKPANSRPKRADPDVAVRVSVRVGPGTDTVTGTGSSKTGTGAGAEGPSADSDGADDEAQDAGTGTEAAEDPDVAADAAGVEEAEAAEAAEAAEDAKDAEDTARERPGADDGDDSKGPAADREDGGDQGPAAAQDILKRYVKPLVSDLPERPDDDGPVVFGIPGRPVIARPTPYAPARPVPEPLPPAERSAVREAGARAATAGLGVGTDLAAAEGEAVGPEGTRAMEVPPAPYQAPLKLLAELTNTPPPRQTAWRSTLRRFKIWTPLVVLLAVVFVIVQAVRPLPAPDLSLTAAPTFTFLGTPLPDSMPWPAQGQSVAEVEGLGSLGVHGAQTPVPIASVTKVMTAYLILRDHPLTGKQNGPLITVDQQAADESSSTDESTAAVKVGQRFSERQMLQMLLIPSGNNIARLLARWDSGTQEAFVTKMTAAAAQLGMANTTYTGASGFEETTVSTAEDQLKLARQVMKNDAFRSVVSLPNVEIPGVGTIFNNNNDLVNQGVVGIKTGSSTPAGGALMWAAHKTVGGKQQLILGVVLQQRGGTTVFDSLQTALKNSQKLIESVQGGLTSSTIVKKGEVVGEVHDGLGGSTPVVADKDLVAIGWPGMKADITLDANSSGVPHNAKAGTQVGTIGFGTGSARTSVPVVLGSDLKEPSFTKKLTRF